MKKMIFLSALFALSALSSHGQDAKSGAVLVAPKPIEKPKDETKPPLTVPKMTNAILGKPVEYGGYFTEVIKAEKKRPLYDLSAPLDPQKDLENLVFNSNPDVAQPFVLFRIKF